MARRESSTPVLRKLVTTGPKLLAAAKGRTGGDNSVRLTVAARGLNGLNIDENTKNGRVPGPTSENRCHVAAFSFALQQFKIPQRALASLACSPHRHTSELSASVSDTHPGYLPLRRPSQLGSSVPATLPRALGLIPHHTAGLATPALPQSDLHRDSPATYVRSGSRAVSRPNSSEL